MVKNTGVIKLGDFGCTVTVCLHVVCFVCAHARVCVSVHCGVCCVVCTYGVVCVCFWMYLRLWICMTNLCPLMHSFC